MPAEVVVKIDIDETIRQAGLETAVRALDGQDDRVLRR